MGLFDRLANRFGYSRVPALVDRAPYQLHSSTKTTLPDSPEPWMLRTAEGEKWTMPSLDTAEAQAMLYRRVSWVQIAVSTVSQFCATVPLNVMRNVGDKHEDVPNHPFEILLSKPNPLQSRSEFITWIYNWYNLTGNAYIWLNRRNANTAPNEMWLLPTNQTVPVPDGRMFIAGYEYDPLDGSKPVLLEPWEVVHLRAFNPLSWFVGASPLEALNYVVQGDIAQQKWNTNLFAANNAKVPGGLAFADPITDPVWAKMQSEIRGEFGGAKNSQLLMMRNVGAGGVEWIPMAMSQKDMEFLAGRKFTKEEIFSVYAPGLASMIDVNATEANATAGKDTFRELAIWPRLSLLAEKITNDILPVYGDEYIAEFEDVRIRDRAMELAEMQQFAQAHTVNEVREKAGSPPLADERGDLFIVQVIPQSGGVQEVLQPSMGDSAEDDDRGNREPQNEPTDEPDDEPEADEDAKRGERKALKKWLKNHPGKDIHGFKARYLSHDEIHAIGESEAATAHPPFVWPSGELTHEAYKALLLQLDPDDDEAEQRIAGLLVNQSQDELEKALRDWLREVFPSGTPESEIANWETRLLSGQAKFRDVLARVLTHSTDLGVNVAFDQLGGVGISFDYTLVNTQARQWAADYVGQLITNVGDTTRAAVRQAVSQWVNTGRPLPSLIRDLTPAFGRQRAKLIAATEVTRAFAEGNEIAYRESGVVAEYEIQTARDERVCPICGSHYGKRYPMGSMTKPPFHPGCRCWIIPVVSD